jgi:hypothetical protein
MKTGRRAAKRLGVEELESRLVLSAVMAPNWAGYVVDTSPGAVTGVRGSWVVRPVSGSANAVSAVWVGIDGFSSPTVEQTGTTAALINGRPTYFAWYEMFPSDSVVVKKLTIRPGNQMMADVTSLGHGEFRLQITDMTTGKSFTTLQSGPNTHRSSAEWIVEDPTAFPTRTGPGRGGQPSSSGGSFVPPGFLPLPNFGRITFSQASVTLGTTTTPIDHSSGQDYPLTMGYFTGAHATPSALKDSVSRLARRKHHVSSTFTVSYDAP